MMNCPVKQHPPNTRVSKTTMMTVAVKIAPLNKAHTSLLSDLSAHYLLFKLHSTRRTCKVYNRPYSFELIESSSVSNIGLVKVSFRGRTGSIRWSLLDLNEEQFRTDRTISSVNTVSLVKVSFGSNTGSIKDDPYWISRKNSLELIEPSSINKVSLV